MDKDVIPTPPSEGFLDIKFNLWGWADDAEGYRIIADLIPKSKNIAELIETLDEINQILSEKKLPYTFDGTIDSLRYFIENHGFDVNSIKSPLLKETVSKHLYDPIKSQEVKINYDRWSGQALRCKAVVLGLCMKNGKLHIAQGLEAADSILNLNENDFPVLDGDIEKGRIPSESMRRLTSLNAMWSAVAYINPWSEKKVRDVGMLIIEEMMSSYIPGSFFYNLFLRLDPHIESVAEKYFLGFHKTDHRACVAVRHAALIVLYRILSDMPEESKRHPTLRLDGLFNKWIEYIFTLEFKFQEWFLEYLSEEMDKRIKFLKMLADGGIFMEFDPEIEQKMREIWKEKYRPPIKDQLYYLPVFESFRLVPPGSINLFGRLVTIFQNRDLPIQDKDEIAKNIIFNIQKIIAGKAPVAPKDRQEVHFERQEKYVKDAFMMLVLNVLVPLARQTYRREVAGKILDLDEREELQQIVNVELLASILKYDATKNNSFFGYIKSMFPWNVKSGIREKKTEQMSSSLDEIVENQPEMLAFQSDLERVVDQDQLQKKVSECLAVLPEKEKEAIKKLFFKHEKLNGTEKRAKNRGIQKLKKQYPELKELMI